MLLSKSKLTIVNQPLLKSNFKEEDHPRKSDGKFAKKGEAETDTKKQKKSTKKSTAKTTTAKTPKTSTKKAEPKKGAGKSERSKVADKQNAGNESKSKKPQGKATTKATPKASAKGKVKSAPASKKEDLTKLSIEELRKRSLAIEEQYKKEAHELYSAEMQRLKDLERQLSHEGSEVSKWRKSKKRTTEYERVERERGKALRQHNELFAKQQEHIGQYRTSEVSMEIRRRNEVFNREREGSLLPDEEKALEAKIGAKPFSASAPKEKFYRHKLNGWDTRATTGVPLDLGFSLDGFIEYNERQSEYNIFIGQTGERIETYYPPNEDITHEEKLRRAANRARLKIDRIVNGDEYRQGIGKEGIQSRLKESLQTRGMSPRYSEDGSVKSGMNKTKAGQTKSKQTFHKFTRSAEGTGYTEVEGTKIKVHPDLHTFYTVTNNSNGTKSYVITDIRSGLMVGNGTTKAEAVEKVQNTIEKHGIEKVKQLINDAVSRQGESPSWGKLQKSHNVDLHGIFQRMWAWNVEQAKKLGDNREVSDALHASKVDDLKYLPKEIAEKYQARLDAMQQRRNPEGIESGEIKRFAYEIDWTNGSYTVEDVFYIPVNRLKVIYQTDEATDWDKVKENMERMKAGEALEPVVIGYDHDVHDGHHRRLAAIALDHTHVPCEVKGTNEVLLQRAKEMYAGLWKSFREEDHPRDSSGRFTSKGEGSSISEPRKGYGKKKAEGSLQNHKNAFDTVFGTGKKLKVKHGKPVANFNDIPEKELKVGQTYKYGSGSFTLTRIESKRNGKKQFYGVNADTSYAQQEQPFYHIPKMAGRTKDSEIRESTKTTKTTKKASEAKKDTAKKDTAKKDTAKKDTTKKPTKKPSEAKKTTKTSAKKTAPKATKSKTPKAKEAAPKIKPAESSKPLPKTQKPTVVKKQNEFPETYVNDWDNHAHIRIKAERVGSYAVHGKTINSPEDLAHMFADLADLDREKLYVVAMKGNTPIATQCVHIGTINSSVAHPKDLIKIPLLSKADGFYLLHNHPSGQSAPSPEDMTMTKRLKETGKAMGIELKGHAVIGDDFHFMDSNGNLAHFGYINQEKANQRDSQIPVYDTTQERKREGITHQVTSPFDIKNYVESKLDLLSDHDTAYMLTMNTKNQITGAIPLDMTKGDTELRKDMLSHIVHTNSPSVAFATGNDLKFERLKGIGFKQDAKALLSADVLDVLYRDTDWHGNITYKSLRERDWDSMKAIIFDFQKSVIPDPVTESPYPEDGTVMFRGIGEKELEFIRKHGYVQSKGKGNDGDKAKRETCFSTTFRQALGYAKSNYDLYDEKQAYVLVIPKPPWVTEDEHGELVSDQPVPFRASVIIPIPKE